MKIRENRIEFRLHSQQKEQLSKIAKQYGLTLSDYIKMKVFNENQDIDNNEVRYVSPQASKHNLLSVSILYKTLYMVMEILNKQGFSQEEILKMEQNSLEYARDKREKQGYRVLMEEETEE